MTVAFFALHTIFFLKAICAYFTLSHFWCSVITSVTFRSNLDKFEVKEKNKNKIEKSKIRKNTKNTKNTIKSKKSAKKTLKKNIKKKIKKMEKKF